MRIWPTGIHNEQGLSISWSLVHKQATFMNKRTTKQVLEII